MLDVRDFLRDVPAEFLKGPRVVKNSLVLFTKNPRVWN